LFKEGPISRIATAELAKLGPDSTAIDHPAVLHIHLSAIAQPNPPACSDDDNTVF
jgi:hypothetical protein